MQLNPKMLQKILALNDAELAEFVRKIAEESGIDPKAMGIDTQNIRTLREVLGSTSESDTAQFEEIYRSYQNSRRK